MIFRFVAALILLTAVSLFGIRLEKESLALKRQISLQHTELTELDELRTRLFLETQQLGAPPRLLREWDVASSVNLSKEAVGDQDRPVTPPLLQWRMQGRAE